MKDKFTEEDAIEHIQYLRTIIEHARAADNSELISEITAELSRIIRYIQNKYFCAKMNYAPETSYETIKYFSSDEEYVKYLYNRYSKILPLLLSHQKDS